MKNEEKIMGATHVLLVLLVCTVVVIWAMQRREVPQVRHAMEASYGEEPKPEDHGL